MDGRERVLTALDGDEPDRAPRALSFYHVEVELPPVPNGVVLRSERDAEQAEVHGVQLRAQQGPLRVEQVVDVDFVDFPPSPEEQELLRSAERFPPDTRLGTQAQVTNYARWRYRPQSPDRGNPLARAQTFADLNSFPFPDVSTPYQAKGLASQVQQLHARGLAAGGNLPHLGGELFEAAWRLRGLEQFLLDLLERPDWAHFLLDRLTELACRNAKTLAGAGIDVLALDDDVGMPGTMMISPATWQVFFKPRLAEIIQAARATKPDVRVLYHSDGYFEPIIGDLMEIGVNAINPLQPEYMDAVSIRRRFGPRLAFWGTVGRQTTFSFAKPEEIRMEVKERIETLGHAGLILCPAYDIDEPDIPWQNVMAFLEAAEEYGSKEIASTNSTNQVGGL